MSNIDSWFLIVNPNSGTRNFQKSWKHIQKTLFIQNIDYSFYFTQYSKHEILLTEEAIQQGYRKIISVGGDGTLHHVVNGIMQQIYTNSSEIKLGVIPMGTGNDWIKTYAIPKNIEQAIQIINEEQTDIQDIGMIELEDSSKEYFINMAGIGYDGYVVNKLHTLKKFGFIAYLLSGLQGLLFYKKSNYSVKINNERIEEKCLMILFGICRYSGGGMQMTKESDPKDGLLDITIAKNFSFLDLVLNLPKLYNGKIVAHEKVDNFKATSVKIIVKSKPKSYIEADGELIGTGSLKVSVIPNAIQVIVKRST
jgi:YegS/Rv2252/BmrU family lipid kinase